MPRPRLTHMPHLEARRQAETEARTVQRGTPLVPSCSICGTSPAPYGYGFGALHACMDPACQAACEGRPHPKSETGRAADAA